jgi:Fic family protein
LHYFLGWWDPFQDGNGRLSRVLTTLLLLQVGYAYVPYSSLESVIEPLPVACPSITTL